MKKFLFTITLALGAALMAHAQEAPEYKRFIFSQSSETYTHLSEDAIEVDYPLEEGELFWDDFYSDEITMPFPFTYQNVVIENFSIDSYGGLAFNETYGEVLENQIMSLYMDYSATETRGKILYETIGTEGSRILKIEFQNVSTYANHTGDDTLNFQIWLHEGTNVIETRVGYSNLPESAFASSIEDIMEEGNKEFLINTVLTNEGDELKTDPTEVYLHYIVDNEGVYTDSLKIVDGFYDDEIATLALLLEKYPAEGTILRYTPIAETSGLQSISATDMNVYPNPAQNSLNINVMNGDIQNAAYTVYDIYGRIMLTDVLNNAHTIINIESLPAGQYILKVSSDTHQGIQKFTKL